MKIGEEISRDLDFTRPRVVVTDSMVLLENVAGIVMLSEQAITVSHGLKHVKAPQKVRPQMYTTIRGRNLVIREIYEGRLLIGGTIEKAEFLQPSDFREN